MDIEPINVLLIEDNLTYARMLQDTLAAEKFPFSVVHTDLLSTGLELLSASSIDVVLLDLSLPDAEGLETFTQLHHAVPDVPIIVLTGFDDEDLAIKTVHGGAQDYLIKGHINGNLLMRAVRYAIERHHLLANLSYLATIEERQRIARDLHDSVKQTLFSINMIAETLPYLWKQDPDEIWPNLIELQNLTQGALVEMQTLLVELRPNSFAEVRLGELLRQLTDVFTRQTQIPVTLDIKDDLELPPDVQMTFYRVAQESLNNAIKHAKASQLSVTLACDLMQVALHITDNGRGFEPGKVPPGRLGLEIMHERTAKIGASLDIISQINQGTQIAIRWSKTG